MLVPLLGAAKGALTKPKAKKQDVKIDPAKFSGKVEGSKAKVKGKSRPTTVKPVAPKVVNINVEREKKTVVTGQDPLIKQVELTYVRTIQIQQLLRDRAKQKQKDEKKKLNWFQRLFRKNREEARENLALKVLGGLGGGVISKGKGLLESIMGIIGTLFAGWLLQFIPQIVQAIQTGLEWLRNLGEALKPYVTPVWDALKWLAGTAVKFLEDPDALEKDSNSFLQNLNILDQRLGVIKKAFDLVVAASLFSAGMQIFKSVGGILGGMWDMFRNFRKLWKRIFPNQKFNLKNVKKPNYQQLKLDLGKVTPKKPNVLRRAWNSVANKVKNLRPKKGWIPEGLKRLKIPKGFGLDKLKNVPGLRSAGPILQTALAWFRFEERKQTQSTGKALTGTAVETIAGIKGFSLAANATLPVSGPLMAAPEPLSTIAGALLYTGAGLLGASGLSWASGKASDKIFDKLESGATGHKEGGKVGALTVDKVDDEGRVESVERPGGLKLNERPSIQELIKKESESKLKDSDLIGHSAMYDKPAEVEFIPFPVSSGDSTSGESRSSGEVSLDLGADVYDVAALNREASNLAKVWA